MAARKSPTTTGKTTSLPKGTPVSWKTPQGETHGVVEETLTSPRDIKGHHVAASPEHPQVLVRSDKTGAAAAHKPTAVRKTRRKR